MADSWNGAAATPQCTKRQRPAGTRARATCFLRVLRRVTSAALLACALARTVAGADMAAGIPKDAWPESWFEGPQEASELGLKTFSQAPMLDEQVASGELPPVRERLPDDPLVVEPYKRIGRYGGTMRVFQAVNPPEYPLVMDPQVSEIMPNLASDWEFKDGGHVFELRLRPGLRWSDGAPFTSADFVWYQKHIRLNESLTPVIPARHQGMSVTAPDPLTVRFHFEEPFVFIVQDLAHRGNNYFAPGHFLKRYHPDFRDKEELDKEAKDAGYMNWMAYFQAARRDRFQDPVGTPVMTAYRLVSRSPTLWVQERNPYYPKVDTEGNQLPYIDRVQIQQTARAEVQGAKAATGQMDFAGSSLQTQDIPLYKVGEKAYDYRTLIWNRLHGVDVGIQFNFTIDDAQLRKIFRDRRFRLALSLAIDREEINNIVYFGQGTPRQTTVIPSSRFYEPEFAEAHIKYHPERARELLDAVGLKDVNGDGIRERPDGKPLNVTLE